METILRLLKELSDLIRTRFREMTIISLGFVVYQLATNYKDLNEKYLSSEQAHTQQIITIMQSSSEKDAEIMDKAYKIMNLASEILEQKLPHHGK